MPEEIKNISEKRIPTENDVTNAKVHAEIHSTGEKNHHIAVLKAG